MMHVIKDSLPRRLITFVLAVFLGLPNLASVFGEAPLFTKLISVVVGSAALWIGISVFFVTGVYLHSDRAIFHAWFQRYTIDRDSIASLSAGTAYFDRSRLAVEKTDGSSYEFKMPVTAFKLHRMASTVDLLEHWRKTGSVSASDQR